MEKRLKAYIGYLSKYQKNEIKTEASREEFRQNVLTQIAFFQHERLIHLLVTILFALMTVVTLIANLFLTSLPLLLLTFALVILLVPYIRHYYILENGVQKLYQIYDDLFDDFGKSL